MMKLITILAALSLVASICLAGDAGFRYSLAAQTAARGGLYVAGADGLTTTSINPSSLACLPQNGIQLAVNNLTGQQEYKNQDDALYRSFKDQDYGVSGGFYWRATPKMTVALSTFNAADYRANWPFATYRTKASTIYTSGFDMAHRVRITAIAPSVALQIGVVAIGLSANSYYIAQKTSLPVSNPAWFQDVGLSGYQLEYELDGWSYGLNLGGMIQLSERWRGGLSLRSGYRAELSGVAKSNIYAELDSIPATQVDITSELAMPFQVAAGVVYQLSPEIDVNVDLNYSFWNGTQKTMPVTFAEDFWNSRLSAVDSLSGVQANNITTDMRNCIDFGLGVEYQPAKGLIYRLGYALRGTPVAPGSANLLSPTVNQHCFSLGIGHRTDTIALDAALAYSIGQARTVTPAENLYYAGIYDSHTIGLYLSLNYFFNPALP
ncbi:outer membrane protein transport protein [candidate division KSB1 bacterium]|nr:outer membrane protein transport protein [candidate division KSB1 bacterium]